MQWMRNSRGIHEQSAFDRDMSAESGIRPRRMSGIQYAQTSLTIINY